MTDPTIVTGAEVTLLGLGCELDGERVLHRLTLRVAPGRVVAVVGGTGSGKSTLVRLLVGLREADEGEVLIDGEDLRRASLDRRRELRRRMGVVLPGAGAAPGDASTFASDTARENLTTSLSAHGVTGREADRRSTAALRALGLAEYADVPPGQLPGHARRRLALARALVLDAPLTVLDEVEGALDGAHAAVVVKAVRDAHERTRGTVVVVTHHLGLARAVADEVAVLAHGRIVAHGSPDEVLVGIDDAEEFEERYAGSDWLGVPPAEPEPRRTVRVDPWMVRVAAVGAVVLVALVVLLTHLHRVGGPLPLLP